MDFFEHDITQFIADLRRSRRRFVGVLTAKKSVGARQHGEYDRKWNDVLHHATPGKVLWNGLAGGNAMPRRPCSTLIYDAEGRFSPPVPEFRL